MVEFNYDSEVDILTVDRESRRPEDYKESIPVGDYVVDVDEVGRFLGLEVLNASQNLPFTIEELESIESVELEVKDRSGAETVSVDMRYSGNKGKFSLGYESVKA